MGPDEDRSEIAFFDVETTVPIRSGQRFAILEFGAILVCPKKLVELENYSALVRPSDLRLISSLSVRCNGITPDAVSAAPTFAEIADRVYDILHGRIWAGHNILRFDCARIREAFAEIGQPAPEPKGIIDSLALLTQRFGRRAGDMKMATLATYFGLGQQTHRSLDDVRMNLEVLKYCATVLFLESSLPEVFTEKSWISPNAITRSRTVGKSPGKSSSREANLNKTNHTISLNLDTASLSSPLDQKGTENHPILSLVTQSSEGEGSNLVESNTTQSNSFEMHTLIDEINSELLRTDISMEENNNSVSTETTTAVSISQESSDPVGFIDPNEVSVSSISACHVQHLHGYQRIKLLHRDVNLQIFCSRLKVRFGMSTKFVDNAGRPRLSFVVNASPSLCRVLDACDVVAQRLFLDSMSTSEWRPVVSRKNGFFNYPTVRLNIPTVVCGEVAIYATEIYQKESSGTPKRLAFRNSDASALDTLFTPGTFVDAFFSLDTYDYQQSAGIRLVAKKLIIHSPPVRLQ